MSAVEDKPRREAPEAVVSHAARSAMRLRQVMAGLYPDSGRAQVVVSESGLRLGSVSLQGPAEVFWWEILEEAHKQGRLDALIARVKEDYPAHAELDVAARSALSGSDTAEGFDLLEELLCEKEELIASGRDASAVIARLKELKRSQRNGPQLHRGECLADRFRLIEPLGNGGFATVWKALDRFSRQPVAVKVLHGQWTHDQSRIERFFRGARTMMQLDHPHVVRLVHPPDEESGFHYFVMEYAAGGDLRDLVLKGHLAEREGLRVVAAIGGALQHAHARRIVHRDVKPENILLRADGTPVLADFDLVALADSTGGTRTGALGTFVYAAPEMLMDAKTADHRADVYSLAMTAVFVLARHKLGAEAVRKTEAVVKRLACPERVKEALLCALDEDPDARFQNVAAFCRALTGGDE